MPIPYELINPIPERKFSLGKLVLLIWGISLLFLLAYTLIKDEQRRRSPEYMEQMRIYRKQLYEWERGERTYIPCRP